MNGKVYSRGDGKVLRPVQVFYPNGDSPFTRSKKSARKRPRKLRPETEKPEDVNVENVAFGGSVVQELKMDS
jgi:hypothetical protein